MIFLDLDQDVSRKGCNRFVDQLECKSITIMKNDKSAGISLIIGSILLVLTMVLHPVGGDFQHLVSIVRIGMISHSIGILSVPFMAYGYWGVMQKLETATFLSRVAFSFMIFGLVAVMIAATLNGLVLMQYASSYADASNDVIASLNPILRYNHMFNLANDYIYMVAVGVSMLFWSVAILRLKVIPVWIAYLGILLVLIAALSVTLGFIFTSVGGFQLFIFGSAVWTISVGWYLWR